jgi:UDPglucose 6-dehydrogenase
MKISVVGTGYVGLVSGACFAEVGHDVICVDKDEDKVKLINQRQSPIYEEGLEEILHRQIGNRLKASTDLPQAIQQTDVTFIAVGTPYNGEEIDLRQIKEASRSIGEALQTKTNHHLIVVKSTVVPGTTENVIVKLIEKYSKKQVGESISVGMNPEFLREGVAIQDFMSPDRIVIGCSDEKGREIFRSLYSVFPETDIIHTSNTAAEMIKYTSNSLLATLISFSSEIANLCSKIEGIDAMDVMHGVHLDKRISPIINGKRVTPGIVSYLEGGCGFGGSCFPKDVKALVAYGRKNDQKMDVLSSVVEINKLQPMVLVDKLKYFLPNLQHKTIAILGLAFKPGTDDVRESPALTIIESLKQQGAKVVVFDPKATEMTEREIPSSSQIIYAKSLEDAVLPADALLLVTGWPEFRKVERLVSQYKLDPIIIDGRRFWNHGFVSRFDGIGM